MDGKYCIKRTKMNKMTHFAYNLDIWLGLLRASCGFDSRRECQKILNAKAFRVFTFSLLLFHYYFFTITFSLLLFYYYFFTITFSLLLFLSLLFTLHFSLNSHSGFYVISKSEQLKGVCIFLTSLKVSLL